MPSLPGDESDNERELANTEPSTQPSGSQDQVNHRRNIGRRRRCDTNDEENCSPIAGSDAKQGKDEDIVRLPRGKRRRVNTLKRPRRKSPAGRTSSTGRALASRVASTAEEVQVDEYFQVEDIRGLRQGEEGWEYLVKWEGYRHKHNTWEPATHFEKCPEVLEQFHQKAGLFTVPSS
jgi:hypothetical protein